MPKLDNIKMDKKHVKLWTVFIHLPQDRVKMRVLVNMDGNEPWGSVKGLECLDHLSYYQFLKKKLFFVE